MNVKDIIEFADAEFSKKTVSEVPMDGIHPQVRTYINHTAGILRAPTNFVFGSVLTIIGAILGKKITVVDGAYKNRPNLYSAVVGVASGAKSPIINHCLSPLNKMQAQRYEEYMRAVHAAKQKEEELPIYDKQLIASNETIENLYRVLFNVKAADNGLLMHQDELLNFFGKNAGKYSDGNFVTDFLTLFDAFSTLRVGRVRLDVPMEVSEPFLSILGGVQKKRIDELFIGQEHNGFFSRWQFWLANDESAFINDNDTMPDQIWAEIIERATSADLSRLILRFHNNNQVWSFDDELRQYSTQLADDGEDDLSETIMKQGYIIRRIAAAIHSLNALAEGYRPKEDISEETFEYAVQVVEWLFKNSAIIQRVIEAKQKKPISTKEAILALHSNVGIQNQSMFSESLGGKPDRSYISRILAGKK